jgi:hypothetical protein
VAVGDVNATAACAMVGAKLWIPVVHLEAGLRSRDRRMPEEINRLVTDAIADLLWTPSRDADANLLAEGVPAQRSNASATSWASGRRAGNPPCGMGRRRSAPPKVCASESAAADGVARALHG